MSSLRNSYRAAAGAQDLPRSVFMTTDGQPEGPNDMALDFSVTPGKFYVQPPPGFIWEVKHIDVTISDSGSPAIDGYGSIGPGVVINGFQFFIEVFGFEIPIALPIVDNIGYVSRSSNYDLITFGAGSRVLVYKELFNAYANGILLNGNRNEKFGVNLSDNYSTLEAHTSVIKIASSRNSF